MVSEIAHYWVRHEPERDHIFQHVKMECPPVMEAEALEDYLSALLEGFLLPTGDELLIVEMKPEGYIPPIDRWHPSEIKEQHILKGSPPFSVQDYPAWLKDVQPVGQIDRWLLIGDPTLYGHLVPVKAD